MATIKRSAEAVWKGGGPDGKGTLTTQSGALSNVPYSARHAVRRRQGHQPGRVARRGACRLLQHGACLRPRRRQGISRTSCARPPCDDRKGRRRLDHEEQRLTLKGQGPRHFGSRFQEGRRGGQGGMPDLEALQGRRDHARRGACLSRRPRTTLKAKRPALAGRFLRRWRRLSSPPRLRPRAFFAGAAPALRPSPMRLARSERALA